MAPTSNLFNLGPISLILYPPISLTPYYSLYPFYYYCPKFFSSSLEYSALNYRIAAYYLALLIISTWIWIAIVIAMGQNQPSLTVIPTVMPIVTPTATLTVASTMTLIALLDLTLIASLDLTLIALLDLILIALLDLIILVKRPLKRGFIRIKTIY